MAMTDRSIVLVSKSAGTPKESWWCCAEDDFATRASAELQRMKVSRFGSMQLGTSVSDAKVARRRLMPV